MFVGLNQMLLSKISIHTFYFYVPMAVAIQNGRFHVSFLKRMVLFCTQNLIIRYTLIVSCLMFCMISQRPIECNYDFVCFLATCFPHIIQRLKLEMRVPVTTKNFVS